MIPGSPGRDSIPPAPPHMIHARFAGPPGCCPIRSAAGFLSYPPAPIINNLLILHESAGPSARSSTPLPGRIAYHGLHKSAPPRTDYDHTPPPVLIARAITARWDPRHRGVNPFLYTPELQNTDPHRAVNSFRCRRDRPLHAGHQSHQVLHQSRHRQPPVAAHRTPIPD